MSRQRKADPARSQFGQVDEPLDGRKSLYGVVGETEEAVHQIPIDTVRPNPNQPRRYFDERALQELARSIESRGLINPIRVRPLPEGGHVIVSGERRWRAHKLLGRKTIAAIVTRRGADEISLIENLQREDLRPLEEAEGVSRLMRQFEYTQEEAATILGKDQAYISGLLRLCTLPAWVKEELVDLLPQPSRSVLVEIARIEDADQLWAAWSRVRDGEARVRDIKALRRDLARSNGPSPTTETMVRRKFLRETRKAAQVVAAVRENPSVLGPEGTEQLHALRSEIEKLLSVLSARDSIQPPVASGA